MKISPETIHDNSPLIRNLECQEPVPITTQSVHKSVHDLYVKAGMLSPRPVGRCYELRVHSMCKFFRTQLAALGVQTNFIEYMIRHTISTYHDVQMKGIEYIRRHIRSIWAKHQTENASKQN